MTSAHDVLGMVQFVLARPGRPVDDRLQEALRLLCKHRSDWLAERLLADQPAVVRSGPFAGMRLPSQVSEGCYLPRLLGIYEQELDSVFESLPQRGYQTVLNVGCADGYYAVGLALLMPDVEVSAHDIRGRARQACAEMAAANGVADRVKVGGEVRHGDFAAFADRHTLVVCDIEGGEKQLLDPDAAPALRRMDLLVELHDIMVPGTRQVLLSRFADSHDIQAVPWSDHRYDAGQLEGLDHLDQLLCVWEWRLAGNDWLWMTARQR